MAEACPIIECSEMLPSQDGESGYGLSGIGVEIENVIDEAPFLTREIFANYEITVA